jgi:hypothetical protein
VSSPVAASRQPSSYKADGVKAVEGRRADHVAAGLDVRFPIVDVSSTLAWMTKPPRETDLPGTELIGSMVPRRAPERLASWESVQAFG